MKKEYDFEAIRKMSKAQKAQAVQQISKTANARLRALENAGYTQHAYEMARHDTGAKRGEKARFYTGSKFKTESQLDTQLSHLESFMNAKTSTVSGTIQVMNERHNRMRETLAEQGINLKDSDFKAFYEFLSSKQFSHLSGLADSNQVMEDFAQALQQGVPASQIKRDYQEFLNGDISTFDQVAKKRANRQTTKRSRGKRSATKNKAKKRKLYR